MVRNVGEHLWGQSYVATLVAVGGGKLGMPIPAPLLKLIGLRKEQRLRARVVAGKVVLTARCITSSSARGMSRRHTGAERVRFEVKLQRLLRSLNRSRRGKCS